jgi:hypothetical protein
LRFYLKEKGSRPRDKKRIISKIRSKKVFIVEPENKLVLHFQLTGNNYDLVNKQTGKLTSFLLGKTFEF